MDPVTQGTVGALFPQAVAKHKAHKAALILGFLSGMAADLDSLIRSATDSLLYLEYHRQFTHSILFMPVGALICTWGLSWLFRGKITFSTTYLFCLLGYATHAFIDACTSYGTQLFWPFSSERVAWDLISIIDPLFTLPLLVFMLLSFFTRKSLYAKIGIIYIFLYLGLGFLQRERAVAYMAQVAQQRGHELQRVTAKPSFGNILVWKLLYEANERYYLGAVYLGRTEKFYEGESIAKLNVERDFPWVNQGSQHSIDIERFRWFSQNYLALHPGRNNFIIDARYSLLPNQFDPLWGIELFPGQTGRHVKFQFTRKVTKAKRNIFWLMLQGKETPQG